MNRKFVLVCILILLYLPVASLATSADDILGYWITEGKDTLLEVYENDGRYSGRIISLKYPNYLEGEMQGQPKVDQNNPNENKRSRPLIGIEIINGFRFEQGKWIDGTIYDPDNGKTYKCEISLSKDGMLDVRGYIGISLLGRTTRWERPEVYLERELGFLGEYYTCEKIHIHHGEKE